MLALDLGERRIGVALSDSAGVLASPHSVLERSGDERADRARLAEIVAETGAALVLVGLPLSLSGAEGPAARKAKEEAARLGELLSVPVELADERLTTLEAARRRRLRADEAAGGRRRRRSGRAGIDAEAAAVLLEAWLAKRAQHR